MAHEPARFQPAQQRPHAGIGQGMLRPEALAYLFRRRRALLGDEVDDGPLQAGEGDGMNCYDVSRY